MMLLLMSRAAFAGWPLTGFIGKAQLVEEEQKGSGEDEVGEVTTEQSHGNCRTTLVDGWLVGCGARTGVTRT